MNNPVKLLKDDHKKIKQLFKEFEGADGRSKRRIVEQTIELLEVHNDIEESIFYPQLRKVFADEFIIEEGLEEHHVIRMLIEELKILDTIDIHFEAKFKVLDENTVHHFEEEEEKMFPKASKLGEDLLDSIGEEMRIRKEELLMAVEA